MLNPLRLRSPLVLIFGKDLAVLISRHVHRLTIQQVNEEYFQRLRGIREDGAVVFSGEICGDFVFNFRHYNLAAVGKHYLWKSVFGFVCTGICSMHRGKTHNLPANY